MVDATTVSGTRPSLRRKMLSSFQEGAMHEALHTLRKSRAGYVSAMTNACSQIDILLVDYANLVKVKSLQSTLDKAWRNFQENVTRCKSLLDENSDEIYEVDTQYATQETRKYQYDQKTEQYAIAAATHFNEQVSPDLANFGMTSPARSLRSASSRTFSKLSEASARLYDTRTATAKAALAAKQTEQQRKRSIEIEMKRLEMEMSQKRVELELAKLEADRDVAEARERAEIAELEAKLAEAEYSELMLNAKSSSHSGHVVSELALGITSNTSSLTTVPASTQVNTFPVMSTQAHTLPAVSTQAYTRPAVSTQAYTLPAVPTQAYMVPSVSTQAYTLPAVSTQACTLPAVSTQAYTLPAVSTRAYTLPAVSMQAYAPPALSTQAYASPAVPTQAYTLPSVSTQAYTFPAVSTQAYTLPAVSTQAYTLPAVSTQAYTFPAVSTKAYLPSAVSSQAYTLPAVSSQAYTLPALYTQAYTRPVVSTQVPAVPTALSSQIPRPSEAASCVSSFPVGPAMFSVPSYTADFSGARVVHCYDPVVPLHHSAPGLSAAASSYNYRLVSSVADVPQCILPTPQPVGGNLLAMIAATMEKMNADHGLPALQVVKFDGSPENYPMFRQRFRQMVEWKVLDEPTKMARLLQFLDDPALLVVQRYESVPGGLAKALQVLQDRFGQPFKIVRACVDTLVKGPVIAPQDKKGLQRYADKAQVMYDTLEAMNYLGEMNTDNLEKMILRLPKWAQAKFREHLKKLEHQGRIMPIFKDVVNFLNDRADVANHPFFSSSSTETKPTNSKRPNTNDQTSPFKFTTLTTEGAKKDSEDSNPEVSKDRKTGNCPMCGRSHPLYRCEMFKSKPVEERAEFVKKKRICFNLINSVEHSSRSCKSSVRCRAPECGKPHHTLLHLPMASPERNVVFDAAAKFKGTSLNDQLYQGPDLANSLTGVLIRFRQDKVAFIADLEAMFHQVKVLPKDAHALRFLWWSGSLNNPPDECQMLVHIFGATSSPCCANRSVRQTADDNEDRFSPEVINIVRRNFYVDDVLKSVPNEESAIRLAEQLIQLMKEGGFHLTKFASNSFCPSFLRRNEQILP